MIATNSGKSVHHNFANKKKVIYKLLFCDLEGFASGPLWDGLENQQDGVKLLSSVWSAMLMKR